LPETNCTTKIAREKRKQEKNSKQLKVREEAAKLCQVVGRACEKVFQTHKKASNAKVKKRGRQCGRERERDMVDF